MKAASGSKQELLDWCHIVATLTCSTLHAQPVHVLIGECSLTSFTSCVFGIMLAVQDKACQVYIAP